MSTYNLKLKIVSFFRKCIFAFLCCSLFSCEPIAPGTNEDNGNQDASIQGLFVLNEGLFNMNNSSISYYDCRTRQVTLDLFTEVNGRGLGDTGNDLKQYGSKLYCVVSVSDRIEVIDIVTGISEKSISLSGRHPRKVDFYNGNAYVCCFDGTIQKIDTVSLAVVASLEAGDNPEDLCIANGKIYVANSGGLNYPNYGHTVSVVDIATFSIIKDIEVAPNPCIISSDNEGDVYLVSRGNYDDVPYTFQRISSVEDQVIQIFDSKVYDFVISGNYAYLYHYDFNTLESWIKVMDIVSETIVKENFITDGTVIHTPYCISVNSNNGNVYIGDAYNFSVSGDIYCFDRHGVKQNQFEVGIAPTAILFY